MTWLLAISFVFFSHPLFFFLKIRDHYPFLCIVLILYVTTIISSYCSFAATKKEKEERKKACLVLNYSGGVLTYGHTGHTALLELMVPEVPVTVLFGPLCLFCLHALLPNNLELSHFFLAKMKQRYLTSSWKAVQIRGFKLTRNSNISEVMRRSFKVLSMISTWADMNVILNRAISSHFSYITYRLINHRKR
ncbi:uncharacterized protein GGS25DRAFT_509520, partial [Hypoxylon fragiforme]|uniref:uncharacterized protein n=1 Tax=Hypoxylon fragiforme TaxID=63214 RepID=UPI0020C6946B